MQRAVQHENVDMVCALVEAGADNSLLQDEWHSELHTAAEFDRPQLVRAVLAAGVHIDSPRQNFSARFAKGATALEVAVQCGHEAIVDLLIELDASVDKENKAGGTPLRAAAFAGQVSITNKLLAAGASKEKANVDVPDKGSLFFEKAPLLEVIHCQPSLDQSDSSAQMAVARDS